MQRSVSGEVIQSTFDRPADEHIAIAELAIERAKRLVELGHDVVMLLDSVTRLGRAYNIAAPTPAASWRRGIGQRALPAQAVLRRGAQHRARRLADHSRHRPGQTGSRMDDVFFEEFKGTGNMELKLSRQLADKRIFPAIDIEAPAPPGRTSHGPPRADAELAAAPGPASLDDQQALELLIAKMKETGSNAEFLLQVQQTSPDRHPVAAVEGSQHRGPGAAHGFRRRLVRGDPVPQIVVGRQPQQRTGQPAEAVAEQAFTAEVTKSATPLPVCATTGTPPSAPRAPPGRRTPGPRRQEDIRGRQYSRTSVRSNRPVSRSQPPMSCRRAYRSIAARAGPSPTTVARMGV